MKVRSLIGRAVAPLFLVACLLLGGSSGGGFFANAALQLLSFAVILLLVASRSVPPLPQPARTLLWIVAVVTAYLLLTLVPLPGAIWSGLPGRAGVADGFRLLNQPLPAEALSLDTDGTIRGLMSLAPPLAMFLAMMAAPAAGRRDTVTVLIVAAIVEIVYGAVQLATGYNSPYYIYYFTSYGGAVGFFANRNHLATMCLMAMPFLAALLAGGTREPRSNRVGRRIIIGGALLFLVLGVGMVQSLAGWLLLLPALLGCLLIYRHGRIDGSARWRIVPPVAALVVAVGVIAALFAPISPADLHRTTGEVDPHQRSLIAVTTWHAARDYLPVGSGLGSFTQVYPRYENPERTTVTYVNHAHDEFLEIVLELGIPGVLLLAAFLIWWGRRMIALWRRSARGRPLARAATVALALLLAHSLVDYPVRTAAIAAVAAVACAMMSVAEEVEPQRTRARRGRRSIVIGQGMRERDPADMIAL